MLPVTIDSLKTLAQKMNFVSFDTLHIEEQSVKSHWYRHDEGLDLYFFQKDDGRMIKVHLSFFGQVIEWNPFDGTRTGLMIEQEQGSEITETVQFDARTNSASVDQSLVILENASCLSEPLRRDLCKLLKPSQKTSARQNGSLYLTLKNAWNRFALKRKL